MKLAPCALALRAALFVAATVPLAVPMGCGATSASPSPGGKARISAIGAESEYADVIEQIGGKYVSVSAIESNPNIDPHTFEASPSIAQALSGASLVVQNGLGYDDYMDKIEAASPSSSRKVIDVQDLLALPDSTPNPHLWYKPTTMPALAAALVRDLSALQPNHGSYFEANERKFKQSLKPWFSALRQFKARFPGTAVASTEPVADYMLEAAGIKNLTPLSMQADVMNGTDPPPQDVTFQQGLFSGHRVKALIYNQQVTDSLTQTFLEDAAKAAIPVVGVYETMPSGYHYQQWMLAEVKALERALAHQISTKSL